MRKYFAYGSNMSESTMRAACPQHRFLGTALLPGHRLAFTRRSVRTGSGVADVVAAPEGVVWGVLYEVADADLEALDRKEGAGWAYARRDVRVLAGDGTPDEAVTYVVITKAATEIPPSPEYARKLVAAARARRLPADYVEALASVRPETAPA